MLKINAISMVELFHQKRKQMILFPCTLFCYCLFDMDFIYALIYIDIIFFRYNYNIKQIPNYGRSLNSTMNVYNLELVRHNKVRNQMLPINKTYFLFTVDMMLYLTFSYRDVCIFAKTTALFNYIFIQEKSIVFTVSIKFLINLTQRF